MKIIQSKSKYGLDKKILVDASDFEKVKNINWYITSLGYAISTSRINGKRIFLHEFILQKPNGFDIDHINGNGLDNRRRNLRICTHAENGRNMKKRVKGFPTSIFKGVDWNKKQQMWRARIKKDYHQIHIGFFNKQETAAWAYDLFARELFGEYARLNFPTSYGN